MGYLDLIIKGIGMVMGVAEGRRNRLLLRQQAKTTRAQAGADADSISREYRQIAGRQAAAIAENGGGYEGSNAKVLHQSETLAFLDRLNKLYHGNLEAIGLEEAGETALRQSLMAGTQQLGSTGSGLYTSGKTTPQGSY